MRWRSACAVRQTKRLVSSRARNGRLRNQRSAAQRFGGSRRNIRRESGGCSGHGPARTCICTGTVGRRAPIRPQSVLRSQKQSKHPSERLLGVSPSTQGLKSLCVKRLGEPAAHARERSSICRSLARSSRSPSHGKEARHAPGWLVVALLSLRRAVPAFLLTTTTTIIIGFKAPTFNWSSFRFGNPLSFFFQLFLCEMK